MDAAAARKKPLWARLLATAGLVAGATGLGVVARGHFAASDFVMLYLLVIAFAAGAFGRACALVASALSVLAYDFTFVPPFHTFAVADERHLLTFATMFGVGVLISELTQRNRTLADTAATADLRARTEEMRSSLLSAVSHDLRTPLGAITGAATTLRDSGDAVDDAQRKELVDTICEEAQRLERFVVNLLEMTRLDAGAVTLRRDWVPLEEIVGSALTRLEAALGGRNVSVRIAPDLPLLSVDPVLFEQALFNLLDNAAKHTPSTARVSVDGRVEEGRVVIEVADSGPGLSPGDEARVFEKFVRGPTPSSAGAGLGLAISRAIVQAHAGEISAGRSPLGGAVFKIVLPITATPPSVPDERDAAGAATA